MRRLGISGWQSWLLAVSVVPGILRFVVDTWIHKQALDAEGGHTLLRGAFDPEAGEHRERDGAPYRHAGNGTLPLPVLESAEDDYIAGSGGSAGGIRAPGRSGRPRIGVRLRTGGYNF